MEQLAGRARGRGARRTTDDGRRTTAEDEQMQLTSYRRRPLAGVAVTRCQGRRLHLGRLRARRWHVTIRCLALSVGLPSVLGLRLAARLVCALVALAQRPVQPPRSAPVPLARPSRCAIRRLRPRRSQAARRV